MTQPPEAIPAWKIWHPLPLWKVFAVLFVAQIIAALSGDESRQLALLLEKIGQPRG